MHGWISACLSQGSFGFQAQGGEAGGILDSDIGQNFAVQGDLGTAEAIHEAAVGKAVQAGSRVDAGDPQLAELTLFISAVAVSIAERLHYCLVGNFEKLALMAEIAFGELENFLVACFGPYGSFDSGHIKNLPINALWIQAVSLFIRNKLTDIVLIDWRSDQRLAQVALPLCRLLGQYMFFKCL
jgi:hypothetical protein